MNHGLTDLKPECFRKLVSIAEEVGAEVYLVGGAVRDLVQGRNPKDLDFAVEGDADLLSRRFADVSKGTYIPLDPTRGQSRVVVKEGGLTSTFDFAAFRAETITDDLAARDFTINAMAVSLHRSPALIDPLRGAADLAAGLLRHAGPHAFRDDPLRLLRAYRFAATLGFRIVPETTAAIRESSSLALLPAPERLRAEFFPVLTSETCADILQEMGTAGLLRELTGAGAVDIERVRAGEAAAAAVCTRVQEAAVFFSAPTEENITRLSLLKLRLLTRNTLSSGELVSRFRLSTKSRRILESLTQAESASLPQDAVATWRFHRRFGEAAPLAIVAALAEGRLDLSAATALVDLLTVHFPKPRPPLLSTQRIMQVLHLSPGPSVGAAVELLHEAQAAELVATPEEAEAYLRKNLLTNENRCGKKESSIERE